MIEIHPITDRQELVNSALDRLSLINLAGVRMKLADPKEGKGWDDAMLDWAEQEYRRFLALNYAYPDRTIVPDKAVDQFWHYHILDTRAYASDTTAVFGYFLHHFPYLGMRGPEDEEKLVQCYSETRVLYESYFGLNKTDESIAYSYCSSGKCSTCSSA
jgi:hypothetical protein